MKPDLEMKPDLGETYEVLSALIEGGGAHVQINVHNITLDQLDKTWTLNLVEGDANCPSFVSARKRFGVIELVCLDVRRKPTELPAGLEALVESPA